MVGDYHIDMIVRNELDRPSVAFSESRKTGWKIAV